VRHGLRERAAAARAVAIAIAIAVPAHALANGAFPDAQSILTPADRPGQILLVTNFGVIMSADAGATWLWSCETDANMFGMLYQLAPPPSMRLFTVADQGLAFSDDATCTWTTAGGALAGQPVTDAYVDPVASDHVLAVGLQSSIYSVYESRTGGMSFSPALFTAPASYTINSVEIARSDPMTIYLAMTSPATAPLLARSHDGGAHFDIQDLGPSLGKGLLRIIAIDPDDAERVLLRFNGANEQSIALTTDGGATATTPVVANGTFTSFVRLPSGTLLVGGMVDFAVVPGLYRSRDRGASFERLPTPPSIRALSQRDGIVYAATDNFGDGYAIGTSADEGDTWQAVLQYDQVRAILPCLKSRCQATCQTEVDLDLWPQEVCTASAPGMMMGTGGSSGAAGIGGAGGRGGSGGSRPAPPPSDGGCNVSPRFDHEHVHVEVLVLVVGSLTSRRCRRRSSPSSSSRR
jgi:hypothetical protein